MRLPLFLFLVACGPRGDVTLTPDRIDFGEVDFQQIRPDGGYAQTEIAVRNTGVVDLDLEIRGVDEEHVILSAVFVSETPLTLTPLSPDGRVTLQLGVWDYLPGERDTLVEGEFVVDSSDLPEPVYVPWSFTPVRVIEED